MTPKAYRLFQSKILTQIFSDMQASRTGRHTDAILGEGATESPLTKEYEFGDSVTHMDIPSSFTNALLRNGPGLPVRLKPDDIVIHKTRNTPKAATSVLLDMSGSMRHDSQYVNVKRMGLALDGLIRSEYPGDFLAVHRDVHLRQTSAHLGNSRTDAEAGDDLQPRGPAAGRHEQA